MKNLTSLIKSLEPIVKFRNRHGYMKNNWDEGYYFGVKRTVEVLEIKDLNERYTINYIKLKEMLK